LLRKWPNNAYDIEEDAYKTPIFTYSKKLDILVSTIYIIISDVEEESSPIYPEDVVTYSKKETMNLKDTTSVIMQQIPRK
jgi:hypothetical protein